MTTFSQLIDEMVQETKRPDLLEEMIRYLNQTVREVHFEPSRGNVVHYGENRREDEVTATAETGEIWDIPNPATFQAIEAVRYPTNGLGRMDFVPEITPGPNIASREFYFYRSGASFVFGGAYGYGGIGGKIQLSWFEYPPSLKYKTVATRPASYDEEIGWTYHADYQATDELKATARALVSNWLLLRWADVLREGLRAKVYKRLSDDVRQRTSYSLFQQLRQGLYTSEVAQVVGG